MVSSFTDGNCSSSRGRCGVAALAQLDELELDERRLSVRRSEGYRAAERGMKGGGRDDSQRTADSSKRKRARVLQE
jgi:hypothetical protein